MSELLIENKDVVVPGQLLAKGMDYLPSQGTYRDGENIYASRIGLASINGRAIKLIPLCGPYIPKRDDLVICRAIDILMSGWRIDLFASNSAMLNVKDATNTFVGKGTDLSKIISIGDYLAAKVVNVTTQKLVDLSLKGPGLRKLDGGQIVRYSPTKFPRVIGKSGSMVSLIKDMTGCHIIVGQNGIIWVSGKPENEVVAIEAIKMIEQYAHTSGLTDRVKQFLESKNLVVEKREPRRYDSRDGRNDQDEDQYFSPSSGSDSGFDSSESDNQSHDGDSDSHDDEDDDSQSQTYSKKSKRSSEDDD
jgi:exosome complex component RRP4